MMGDGTQFGAGYLWVTGPPTGELGWPDEAVEHGRRRPARAVAAWAIDMQREAVAGDVADACREDRGAWPDGNVELQ